MENQRLPGSALWLDFFEFLVLRQNFSHVQDRRLRL